MSFIHQLHRLNDNKSPCSRRVRVSFIETNIRGFHSKKETLLNILEEKEVKIAVINERHCNNNKPPVLQNYASSSGERVGKRIGGVAVMSSFLLKSKLSSW